MLLSGICACRVWLAAHAGCNHILELARPHCNPSVPPHRQTTQPYLKEPPVIQQTPVLKVSTHTRHLWELLASILDHFIPKTDKNSRAAQRGPEHNASDGLCNNTTSTSGGAGHRCSCPTAGPAQPASSSADPLGPHQHCWPSTWKWTLSCGVCNVWISPFSPEPVLQQSQNHFSWKRSQKVTSNHQPSTPMPTTKPCP